MSNTIEGNTFSALQLEVPPDEGAVTQRCGPAMSQQNQLESMSAGGVAPSASSPSAGTVAPGALARLDANGVMPQLKDLLHDGILSGPSSDDCSAALGLLQSLPPKEFCKAINGMTEKEVDALCQGLNADQRRLLAEATVLNGLTTASPSRRAQGERTPAPPNQPSLIVNRPGLANGLRQVIHDENKARANTYRAQFAHYVDAWCQKAQQCQTPRALRELGPLSTPPSMSEPGISPTDQKNGRFQGALVESGVGLERAAKVVSEKVSAFRHELAAGSFGLDVEAKISLSSATSTADGKRVANGGLTLGSKTTLTDDGRVLTEDPKVRATVGLGVSHTEVEAKYDMNGQLEGAGASVEGVGVELERDGKMTFKGGIVESFANPNEGTFGASVGRSESIGLGNYNAEFDLRLGFTAKGIAREYYQDIGGAQGGFFGPMPELDSGAAWSSMPKERREWYARQGFTEANWPR